MKIYCHLIPIYSYIYTCNRNVQMNYNMKNFANFLLLLSKTHGNILELLNY